MKKAFLLGILAFFAINLATIQTANAQVDDKKEDVAATEAARAAAGTVAPTVTPTSSTEVPAPSSTVSTGKTTLGTTSATTTTTPPTAQPQSVNTRPQSSNAVSTSGRSRVREGARNNNLKLRPQTIVTTTGNTGNATTTTGTDK